MRPLAVVALPVDSARPEAADGHRPGLTVSEVQTPAERAVFLDVLGAGYSAATPVAGLLRAEHDAATVRAFLASSDGRPVAAAGSTVADGVAVLGGASTLPAHRRSGAQQALLVHRLRAAGDVGAVLATATAAPRTPSLRNLQRAGFAVHLRPAWRPDGP